MNAQKILDEILALDAKIADLRDQFKELDEGSRFTALETLTYDLFQRTGDLDPMPMSMLRAVDLVCDLEKGAVILGAGMGHPNENVRELCGHSLVTLSEEGSDAIVPAVDLVLETGGHAAQEMPFVLTYVDSPEATGHIVRFLEVDDAEIVASAIEALAELRDPEAIPALQKLVDDTREVPMDEEDFDDGDDSGAARMLSLGALATDAIEFITEAYGA